MDPATQGTAAGVVLAVFGVGCSIILGLLKEARRAAKQVVTESERQERRLLRLERDNMVCARKLSLLIEFLQHRQIPVPEYVWTLPEQEFPKVEGTDVAI